MRDWDDILLNFFSVLFLVLLLVATIFTCGVMLVRFMDAMNFGLGNLSKCEVKRELKCKRCIND